MTAPWKSPTVLFLFALSLLASPGCSQPSVELVDAPETIYLPAAEDRNVFLTARITGGEAKRVWLSTSADVPTNAVFTRSGEEEFKLNLSEPAVETFAGSADLSNGVRVYAELVDGRKVESVPLRARSSTVRMILPDSIATMRVYQRRAEEIPGSDGTLTLQIDDITNGQVMVTVTPRRGKTLIAREPVRPGIGLPLVVDGSPYVLGCTKLVNLLIGDDHGEFVIATPARWERHKIDMFIELVEDSKLVFQCDNRWRKAEEFASLLRDIRSRQANASFDDLIKTLTTQHCGGTPCTVQFDDGSTKKLADWWP